ncbi:peptidyl-prolyl cis-trans isomerase [Lysobacter helvus]|uniref:Peptidyl-prolyl cis-trans isomerase n=2 Tax=Lysobacteraceae TaxID=32033 RepID=A0ABN6FU93_9GAMM|nr:MULTISPECIES: FKBP-type peptidyl-prolyl cis-trans isomerase N-terminal domain-containing protein [Lysobacter]BCT93292.1 peptidyl-prolyl cis-trans isomerase [Lysobacter caseinilyticus]BCT96445.1 peptidyl-prolyl cis-trans isomerase [Lysobacter helvus]
MKLRLLAASVAALTLVSGLALAQDTTTEKGKLSYYFGYQFGRDLAESGEQVDVNTLVKAVQDGYGKKQPALAEKDLRPAVEAFQKRQQAKAAAAKAAFDKDAAANKTKSDQYLAANKAKAGVKTLAGASGVQYRVMEPGTGAKPTANSTLALEVGGPYLFGQKAADDKIQNIPSIKLSEVQMPAMREALAQMPAGSKWEIVVPPASAFGADPRTGFPPNVAVAFEVKLVSVK